MTPKKEKFVILIVEDDLQFREYLVELLKEMGYQVIVANDVAEGKSLFKFKHPDVVLTDLVLPGIAKGEDLIFYIKEQLPDQPIIAMSGGHRHSERYLEIAKVLGAGAILSKPFLAAELLDAIEAQLAIGSVQYDKR